ncbi:DNA polymerase family A-domain-containing protein [Umbelopsis sp. PMI_123]|nr:DNA polymerase family A-domain-containing protein [Umbelopsis sp. PMI_123]
MLKASHPVCLAQRHWRIGNSWAYLQIRYKVSAATTREESLNPVNVQLLSPALHKQIFPFNSKEPSDLATRQEYALQHLELQNIWGKSADKIPDISLQLPKLTGRDLEDHFLRIGIEQSGSYLQKAKNLAVTELPPQPKYWHRQSGWTRYDAQSGKAEKVDHPLEDILTFDVETAVAVGPQPIMATAASPQAWYSWVSPYLFGESDHPNHLIPFGTTGRERIVIGHNVGFDRARILEEYNIALSKLGFLDTMSMHIAVSGLCSQQRPAWMSEIKRRNMGKVSMASNSSTHHDSVVDRISQNMDVGSNSFFDVSALNSLKDVVKFHCNIDMDKSSRDLLVEGQLDDVQQNFEQLIRYCATDVDMTHRVYKALWPKFHENCPHPISFAGMLQMGNSILTVNEHWEEYLANSVAKHKELEDMLDVKLQELAENARLLVGKDEEWQKDPWLNQLDWFVNPRQRKLKGQPKWYKDAYNTKTGKLKISTRSRMAPLLLRLKWQDHPIHYLSEYGWCFKIPIARADEAGNTKIVSMDEEYFYYKIPHKDGETANCGNPIAKNYLHYFEEGVLSSEYDAAREALELNAKSAYWISSRERILGQYVVWNNEVKDMGLTKRTGNGKNGIILPQMVTMGTVTRRAVEKTWLTASNAKANRIGSELKSMVQAPPGYKIVGADVDSEELWISSIIGDAQFGFHGATALGWMTLQGSKSEGTDLHSKTAQILGISRDKAKVFNYARIYGAGAKYATSLLMQYNQDLTVEEAQQKAAELYLSTKGEKQRSVRNQFKRAFWHGGTESYMFNALEDIALCKEPRTPILGCAITDALKPKYAGTQFLTSRINWVVQSSAVDYLHMMIVSMSHLIDRYNIDARFMLSVHDEVRYLSSEKDQHRTALALQIANLWTRALFSYKLGIPNLPQAVAFFSAVDIDHVLRKEPNMHCLTPSNPNRIEEGRSYSVYETVAELEEQAKANGSKHLLDKERRTVATQISDADITKQLKELNQLLPESRMCDLEFLHAQMFREFKPNKSPSKRGGRATEVKVSRKAMKDIAQEENNDDESITISNDNDDRLLYLKYEDGTMPRSSVRVIQSKVPTLKQSNDDVSSLFIPTGVLDALVQSDPTPLRSSQQRTMKKPANINPTTINWVSA